MTCPISTSSLGASSKLKPFRLTFAFFRESSCENVLTCGLFFFFLRFAPSISHLLHLDDDMRRPERLARPIALPEPERAGLPAQLVEPDRHLLLDRDPPSAGRDRHRPAFEP